MIVSPSMMPMTVAISPGGMVAVGRRVGVAVLAGVGDGSGVGVRVGRGVLVGFRVFVGSGVALGRAVWVSVGLVVAVAGRSVGREAAVGWVVWVAVGRVSAGFDASSISSSITLAAMWVAGSSFVGVMKRSVVEQRQHPRRAIPTKSRNFLILGDILTLTGYQTDW